MIATKWEYILKDMPKMYELEKFLNFMGADGWELCSMTSVLLFKRRIS